jgi:hypothetical protein
MKLVQEKYGDERKFIVSEGLINHGINFGENDNFLTDADEEKHIEFLDSLERNEEELTFKEWLEEKGIGCQYISETCTSMEEVSDLIRSHKYFYDDYNRELQKSKEILNNEECNYLEYWNGHDTRQIEIDDEIIDLKKIESNIEENEQSGNKLGQYNLYKDKEDNLYLHWESYFQGDLGEVEDITEKDLEERFNYTLV